VLAENRFLELVIFDIEQNPFLSHGNPIDEKYEVRPVCLPVVCVLPFVSHLEQVTIDTAKINNGHVAAPLFVFIVNGLLPPEPGQNFRIPLNIVPDSFHTMNDFIHIFPINQSIIQFQQFFFEDLIEQRLFGI
jgi:hypothetical protein